MSKLCNLISEEDKTEGSSIRGVFCIRMMLGSIDRGRNPSKIPSIWFSCCPLSFSIFWTYIFIVYPAGSVTYLHKLDNPPLKIM